MHKQPKSKTKARRPRRKPYVWRDLRIIGKAGKLAQALEGLEVTRSAGVLS